MAVGISEVRYLDAWGRLRVVGNYAAAAALVLAGVLLGVLGQATWSRATVFPYDVHERTMLGRDGSSSAGGELPNIERGDPLGLSMRRVIDYHHTDCERWYSRRAVSEVTDPMTKAQVFHRFEEVYDPQLPWYLSNRPQVWQDTLPATFPCGRAYLAEDVSGSCSWLNAFFKLRKPTIITPFRVVGPGC